MKKQGKLLIVDDEMEIRQILSEIHEDYAEEIICASNGAEALDLMYQENFDCIICDIFMPELDGISLLQELSAKKIRLPFVFYTGHADKNIAPKLKEYGMYELINKPNLAQLEKIVQRGLVFGVDSRNERSLSTLSHTEFLELKKSLISN